MLEVIGINSEDIKKINRSIADQIEFCVDLKFEGLSPSIEDIKKVSLLSNSKNIRIMLRQHYDTFLITKDQTRNLISIILKTINLSNITGYVFGAITKNKKINFDALEIILNSIENKNLTFHKAFDLVENKLEQLNKLMEYKKIKYVLTSGGKGSPLDNLDFFKKIPPKFKDRILIGGGVNNKVILTLTSLGFKNFHTGKYVREEKNYSSDVCHKKIKELKFMIKENTNI